MPPSRSRLRFTALITLLTVCVIFYVTQGASSTHNSQFYTRTVSAIRDKDSTIRDRDSALRERESGKSREEIWAEEKRRLERLDRIEKEHHVALSAQAARETRPVDYSKEETGQNPIIPNGRYGASKVADAKAGEKSVAGRKYMKDGKVVTYKTLNSDGEDGVAKVGNVEPHSSQHAATGAEYEKEVETALNDILRKGPIIIFSKTYCPHSKKAKHILLDLYSIVPPPYVVELDEHKLGSGLQSALERLTGRKTVPNVMINGKSIGGGDEIGELHEDDKIVSTIFSMVGKRMTKVERVDPEVKKTEMKFKA